MSTAARNSATLLSKLVDHCVWANAQWIDFLAMNFPSDEFLMKRMAHIVLGERAWFQRLAGDEPDRDIWKVMTATQLRDVHRRHRTTYGDLLQGNLERVIAYTRFTGEEYQSPVADVLIHLTLHGAHHRGQMATYASAHGRKPPNADFVQYCLVNGL